MRLVIAMVLQFAAISLAYLAAPIHLVLAGALSCCVILLRAQFTVRTLGAESVDKATLGVNWELPVFARNAGQERPVGRVTLYRYRLDRAWGDEDRPLVFVMLNPSTADAQNDDATVRSCIRIARAQGRSALRIANLFALRETSPAKLAAADDPIGPLNDGELGKLLSDCVRRDDWVVVGWGNNGTLRDRDLTFWRMAIESNCKLKCLGYTQEGHPRHPLYLPADTPLVDWPPPHWRREAR